jgi:hypothetical protein
MKPSILDIKNFEYTRAVATDITRKWESIGWVKPSNQLAYVDKWFQYRYRR